MPRYMDFEYSRIDSGIRIDKYTGSATSVNIPSRINDLPITSIGADAFDSCSSLMNITIPDSVTSIGERAFSSCISLKSIIIPDSVSSINWRTFNYCTALVSISIPNSVTSIDDDAFNSCRSLTSIIIPDSVSSIGQYAFSGCISLTSITIPNSVTSIGNNAFNYCSALTSIIIPDSVTSIGYNAFYGCSALTSIIIPDSVTSIGVGTFYGCTSLKNILIPATNIHIDTNAFDNCYSLKITRYGFSSQLFPKNKNFINSELPQLVEQITKLVNSIQRIKSLPLNGELFKSVRQLEALFESKGYSAEFDTAATKILNDVESEYNRQYKIMSNSTLPTELSQKVNRLENTPAISAELLALIKQIKDLGAKDYSPELNDYVAKVLANIETEYNRQQEKNSVIDLIALVESVSGKQITNMPQYVKKFDDEIADFVSNINTAIETLRTKKNAIQNRRSEQKCENEALINATIEALKTEKNAIQNRRSEQKCENEALINATIEALKTEKNAIQNRRSEQKRENEALINAELEALKASLKE